MRLGFTGADQLQRQHPDTGATARHRRPRIGACLLAVGAQLGSLAASLDAMLTARFRPFGATFGPLGTMLAPRLRTLWRRRGSGGADFREQPLGLLRRLRIELVGQHGAAALIGLDRHAALAARGIGAHQRPPGALMRAVDRQQLLCCGNDRLGIGLFAQQVLSQQTGAVAQPLALAGQPCIEARVDAVEVLQQVAVEQRQGGGLGR